MLPKSCIVTPLLFSIRKKSIQKESVYKIFEIPKLDSQFFASNDDDKACIVLLEHTDEQKLYLVCLGELNGIWSSHPTCIGTAAAAKPPSNKDVVVRESIMTV